MISHLRQPCLWLEAPIFKTGQSGTVLDVDRAVILIEDALKSPTSRVVNVSFNRLTPPRPSFQNLQILLQQIINVAQLDGEAELYLLDLQTNQEMHFALQNGKSVPPDIAFTAASTIKIPIMVSIFPAHSRTRFPRALPTCSVA